MSKQAFSNGTSNIIEDNEYKRRKSEEELEKELLYNGDPWIYDGQPIDMKGRNIRLRNDFVCFQMWRALPARSKFVLAAMKMKVTITLPHQANQKMKNHRMKAILIAVKVVVSRKQRQRIKEIHLPPMMTKIVKTNVHSMYIGKSEA